MSQSKAPPSFPSVRWWDDYLVTFEPALDPIEPEQIGAVVVFVRCEGEFVLGKVPRGWCTPSGRLEPGEAPLEAAVREVQEEIGATLENPRLIGRYLLKRRDGTTRIVPTYVGTTRAYGNIPPGSESQGAQRFSRAQIPAVYWHWDDLLERMFEYAERELDRQTDGIES
jgi:8-oxo-dGTP pyrophosphatase MutT (NUDIX family)